MKRTLNSRTTSSKFQKTEAQWWNHLIMAVIWGKGRPSMWTSKHSIHSWLDSPREIQNNCFWLKTSMKRQCRAATQVRTAIQSNKYYLTRISLRNGQKRLWWLTRLQRISHELKSKIGSSQFLGTVEILNFSNSRLKKRSKSSSRFTQVKEEWWSYL